LEGLFSGYGNDLLKMKVSSLAGLPHRLQKGSDPLRRTKLIFPLIILSLEDGFDAVDSEPTNVFNNHPVYRFSDPYKFLRNNYGVVAVSIFIYQGG
jgi:hypothetical protein